MMNSKTWLSAVLLIILMACLPAPSLSVSGVNIGASESFVFARKPTPKLTPPPPSPESSRPSGFFPIGLYCVNIRRPYSNRIIEEFPEIARAGFNLIQSYQFEGDLTDPANTTAAAREYLDAAQRNGLKVLMSVTVNLTASSMEQDLAHIRERVSALKDHPALFGWQLYDEPDSPTKGPIPPRNLEIAYRAIKEIDPLHPVSIATATPLTEVRPYFNGIDIAMPQWLMIPLSYAIEENNAYFMEEIKTLTALNKSIIPHVFVYNLAKDRLICNNGVKSEFEGCKQGYPTKNEIRSMAYYAIIKGAKGLSFNCYRFNYDESDPGDDISPSANPTQWQAISSVATELRFMSPILLAPAEGNTGIATTGGRAEMMLKKFQNRYYLFIVNSSSAPAEFGVRLDPNRFPSPRVVRYPEQQDIPSPAGSFADHWEPYDVRIYEISTQNQWNIMTWGGDTVQWSRQLNLSGLRWGCDNLPAKCVSTGNSEARRENVAKYFVSMSGAATAPSTFSDYALQYSRLSLDNPFLQEIGPDDFALLLENWYVTLQFEPATVHGLLEAILRNTKAVNPNLKFGVTLYENEVSAPAEHYLDDVYLSPDIRNKIDYVHLFVIYRMNGPRYEQYVQQAKQFFPNAKIIAGAYVYDRIDYVPCSQADHEANWWVRNPQARCTFKQEKAYFQQSLEIQARLLKQGVVDWIELFPGFMGNEEQIPWDYYNGPPWGMGCLRARGECIANTKATNDLVLTTLSGTARIFLPPLSR